LGCWKSENKKQGTGTSWFGKAVVKSKAAAFNLELDLG
jgi:hypothetical protein